MGGKGLEYQGSKTGRKIGTCCHSQEKAQPRL